MCPTKVFTTYMQQIVNLKSTHNKAIMTEYMV